MDLTSALAWAAARRHAVFVTLRSDGRPQTSDVLYAGHGSELWISVTDDRAKTRNLRRDGRAVIHISEPSTWSYVSFDGVVDLTATAQDPEDETADLLVAYYEMLNDEPHEDWAAYRQAMVEDKRLIARFRPGSAVGQLH